MAKTWTFDPSLWPATFARKWLWTIFAERAHHSQVVDLCKKIGITDLVILVNDSPVHQPEFGIRGGAISVVTLSKLLRDAGVAVHLGTWLDPSKTYVDACAVGMAKLAKDASASSVILDLEGEWRKRINNHSEFVAGTVAPAFAGFPVPIGITSFAILPDEVAPALAWAVQSHRGFGQPQAYAVFQGKKWQKSELIQPDRLSTRAWRSWSPITRRLVVLEAAYGNTVPGRTIKDGEWTGKAWSTLESFETAAQRAEFDGFTEIGWWSQEALSKKNPAAKIRRESIRSINATGKSMVGKAWRRALAIGAGVLAVAGGIGLAVNRGRR